MFKNLAYGNSSENYSIQEMNTALARIELAGIFFFPVPGPKMIWQFGELGYDYSINYDCRVCNKPIRWDYYKTGLRRRVYQLWSALITLKINEPAFSSDDFSLYVSDAAKRIEINHESMDVRIIGNFDVESLSVNSSFSKSGWWYSYFDGDSINVSDLQQTLPLAPGEYRLYTSKKLVKPHIPAGIDIFQGSGSHFHVYPNPVNGILHMEPLPRSSFLTILNGKGQVMMRLDLEANQEQVDLSFLSPGLYILSRQSGNSTNEFAKVLVN